MRPQLLIPLLVLSTSAEGQQTMTFRQERLGLTVSAPAAWSVQRVTIPDPIEELREGRGGLGWSGGDTEDVADWNAVVFNAAQARGDEHPLPFVRVSAHPAGNESLEDLATWMEASLRQMGVVPTHVDRQFRVGGLAALDLRYDLGAVVRWVVVVHAGTRVAVMAFVPSRDAAAWEASAPVIDAVVRSIRLGAP